MTTQTLTTGRTPSRALALLCLGVAALSIAGLASGLPQYGGGMLVALVLSVAFGFVAVTEMDEQDRARVLKASVVLAVIAGPAMLLASVPEMNAYFVDQATGKDGMGWFVSGSILTLVDVIFFMCWRGDIRDAAAERARKEAAASEAAKVELAKPADGDTVVGD